MPLRRDIRPRITRDLRGKIKSGFKNDRGLPQSLDHFNITAFPELQDIYGSKPDKLILFFPSNQIEAFYSTEYNLWGGGQNGNGIKLRTCDAVDATDHRTGETRECFCEQLPQKQRCKCYTSLKAYISNFDGVIVSPICYQFETHSRNSSDHLYSELDKVSKLTGGRLLGVPFIISVKMHEVLVDGEKKKFPIWNLSTLPDVAQVLELATKGSIPAREGRMIDITGDQPRLLDPTEQARAELLGRPGLPKKSSAS